MVAFATMPAPTSTTASRGARSRRVAVVVHEFPKLSETFVVRHVRGLLDRGWDVHVVCRRSAAWSAFPGLRERLGDRVHLEPRIERRPSTALRLAARLPRVGLRAPRTTAQYLRRFGPLVGARRLLVDAPLRALRPALVHCEFGTLAAERPDLGERIGARFVSSFRGFDLNFADSAEYAPLWRRLDGAHFLGQHLREVALERGCPPDLPHRLIPPAVDPERYPPRLDDASVGRAGPLRLLSVGRLEWKKGFEDALLAVRRLRDAGVDCRYEIVGDGRQREAIAFARHELGLEDVVDLAGAQPHDSVIEAMRRSDVFVHLALTEGFCNAVLEAQAVGLPVVASDAGGLPENLADGTTGLLVPRRDPEAAFRALERLAGDPALRQRLGQAGRERIRRHFRLDQQLDAFEAFYDEMLARPCTGRNRTDRNRRSAA